MEISLRTRRRITAAMRDGAGAEMGLTTCVEVLFLGKWCILGEVR